VASTIKSESDFSDSASGAAVTISASGVAPENQLHFYESYTYRITLFFLTSRDYNELSSAPDKFEPTYSLISSAGAYAQEFSQQVTVSIPGYPTGTVYDTKRHPDFLEDFFIDNLQLTTVVGLNAKSKASNVVEISFGITEPYGLSLLDRLLSACETSTDRNPNYMDQPYLLQIDMLAAPGGYTQSERKITLIDRKRMAIKFIDMKIKPSTSGSTYAITARPYSHTAFSMSVASVPVVMNIEADTVGNFFGGSDDASKLFHEQIDQREQIVQRELDKWQTQRSSAGGQGPTSSEIELQRSAIKNALAYSSTSFTAAYNTYMDSISKEQQLSKLPPTKIAFNFTDAKMAESPIVRADDGSSSDGRLLPQGRGVSSSDAGFRTTQTFPINAGTSIIDVIDMVMTKSDYIKNQIKTFQQEITAQQAQQNYDSTNGRSATAAEISKDLNWYKIVPQIALNDFDASRNAYSKTILYTILPYRATNVYHPNFPKKTAASAEKSIVRTYDYLYTGKNLDVINCDIDFDSAFFTQLTTYRDQVRRLSSNANNDISEAGKTKYSFTQASQQTKPPAPIQYVGSNAESHSINSSASPDDQIVGDLRKSIYTSSRGDMLNIKLKIIGDPAFIKQDDVFYNPSTSEYTRLVDAGNGERPINPTTGQILFDSQQVFVRVNFKNAVDINDSIGIVNKQTKLTNGRSTNGTFSGIYRVLKVQSSFSRGQFTQTLDLIRMPDDVIVSPVKTNKNTTGVSSIQQTNQSVLDAVTNKSNSNVVPEPTGRIINPALLTAAQSPAITPGANE
jgi:hypothetical protein